MPKWITWGLSAAVFAAVAVIMLGSVGQLEERAYDRFPQFIDSALRVAEIETLEASCQENLAEETRFWLLGEQGAVYLLRILGPTFEGNYDGEFYSFDRGRVDRLHRDRAYDWASIVDQLSNWQNAGPGAHGAGLRSILSLVIESCQDGSYHLEVYWNLAERSADERKAATTIKGLIMLLDSPNEVPFTVE